MMKKRIQLLDEQIIIKDAVKELGMPGRRLFGKRATSLGALSMLSGCGLTNENSVEKMLMSISRFNDGAQAVLRVLCGIGSAKN
jgi:hypothetical protein